MSDSISLKVAFPNYKKYSDQLKSFINFFMSYSNLYMKLTPKDTSQVLPTNQPISEITYDSETQSIKFNTAHVDISGDIGYKVKVSNCTIVQTQIGEVIDVPETNGDPIVLDGIYHLSDESGITFVEIGSIPNPDEGFEWTLTDNNPTYDVFSECDLSACIKLDCTKMPFTAHVGPMDMPVPTSEIFVPFTSNYRSFFEVSEEFIPEVASTFSIVDTALSLYDFPDQSTASSEQTEQNEILEEVNSEEQVSNSENTLAYNSNFSLPCKLIPYVNGNPNTDTSYIPYDAVETQNTYVPISIHDSSNITYQLRTSSFAVTSDGTTHTDVFYKVGICSINESTISTNDLISKLLIQSIYVKSNKPFEMAAIYFPEWIPEILFAQTIKGTPVLSDTTENLPCINNIIPLYLQNIASQSQGENLVGLMYIKLYNEDGTEFESNDPLTSNLYYNTESTLTRSDFYITFNNTQLESGKINSMLPSLSMFSNLSGSGMVAPVTPPYEG